jgi:hypothetical protein
MKFKSKDIVCIPGSNDPIVILGHHQFPNGTPAYRVRYCLPGICMSEGTELWPERDHYMIADYVDENYIKLIEERAKD